ncbi:MAG TPA: HypC/HybG/HupF family hydrogenase formation chaperone [Terriglobales bacterium]|nr:HypC/HybG/HupF family hydrogenase formation chaperone [Terriglobales bacterium]
MGNPRRYGKLGTMCLAVPAKIVRLEASGLGVVEYLGNEVRTNFSLLPEAKVGDWAIVHAGFAISLMDEKEARKTLRLFRELAEADR